MKKLIIFLCLFEMTSIKLIAQCSMGTNVSTNSCTATTFAISTVQTFKPTCSGVLKSIVAPNITPYSDDLRSSGYFVLARIRAADGTVLAASLKTDQWYPGATVTFDLLCSNIYLTAGTVYQLDFYESTGTTQLILFCKNTTGIYADGNVIEDGTASPTADLSRWQVNVQPQIISAAASSKTQDVTACGSFLNSSSELIAFVKPGTTNPIAGSTTAKVWIEGTQPAAFVKRHYEITPAVNTATATGKITLYYTQAEFDAFNSLNASKLPANPTDATGKGNLLIEKRPGTSSNGTGLPGTYTGTPLTINPNDADIVWNPAAARWEVAFDVTGFSGFFVKSIATVLPLKWLNISGKINPQNNVVINWKTEETNVANYSVEKSNDAVHFSFLTTIPAIGNGTHSYQATDPEVLQNTAYYRILQTDIDGRNNYSPVIKVNASQAQVDIYPTIFTDGFTVITKAATAAKLIDAQGKNVRQVTLSAGSNYIPAGDLAKGMYIVVFENGSQQRMIKQ